MIPLSATSRVAALCSRPKTRSRQSCRRQIFSPSVSSPEPPHPARPFACDLTHVLNRRYVFGLAVAVRERIVVYGNETILSLNLRRQRQSENRRCSPANRCYFASRGRIGRMAIGVEPGLLRFGSMQIESITLGPSHVAPAPRTLRRRRKYPPGLPIDEDRIFWQDRRPRSGCEVDSRPGR
jgi:hypothetical protein